MTSTLAPSDTLSRTPGVLEAVVNGETVLMNTEATQYFGLDAIGSDLWNQLATPTDLKSLQEYCQAAYTGDPGQIADDVSALVNTLLDHGLVQRK